MQQHPIILFDGVCNLCNGAVQFIIKRDKREVFRFASLQSATGKALMDRYAIPSAYDSIVLIENEKIYFKSTAALRIARKLDGRWPLLSVFMIIPKFARDAIYNFVARRRYRWFGKKSVCMVPSADIKNHFLEDGPSGF